MNNRAAAKLLLLTVVTAFLGIHCHTQTGEEREESSDNSNAVNNTIQDTVLATVNEHRDSLDPTEDGTDTAIATFLEHPLDLARYKETTKANQNHMLNCGLQLNELYKPDTVGFFYRYCLFNALLPKEMRKKNLGSDERLIQINVYRVGLSKHFYNDTNEILVGLASRINQPELEQANFVGQDTIEIRKRFGTEFLTKNNCMIYHDEEKVLILGVEKEKVEWFKFQWLNFTFSDMTELPQGILEWRE